MNRLRSSSLTPKQKQLLEFVLKFQTERGYAPSQQEIARFFGFSSLGTVQNYLTRLERQGALKKDWNARRGIQVVPPVSKTDFTLLPLVGEVAAGFPIEAIETQETLEVPRSWLKAGEHFILKVKGDSMMEEGILSGDYVIVKKQFTAENGQTVVALLENEATIKKFYRSSDGRRIELRPANSNYKPIIIERVHSKEFEGFKILGILVSVLRKVQH